MGLLRGLHWGVCVFVSGFFIFHSSKGSVLPPFYR